MKVRDEDSRAVVVIASDQRERGNLSVVVLNDCEIASASPRNDPRGDFRGNRQSGAALVVGLLILAMLSLMGSAFIGMALTEGNIATNSLEHTQAFYAAEAGLESGVVALRNLLATTPAPTQVLLDALPQPAFSNPNLTLTTFQIQPVQPAYLTTISRGAYAGLNATTTDYQITVDVTGPKGNRARLTQVLQHMNVPLFQFGVFYGRGVDLEIAPGKPMTFNGRVHANSNLYVRSDDTSDSLSFDSFMTTVGNVYRYLKRDAIITRNRNPQIKDNTGTYRTLNFDHDSNVNFAGSWPVQDWRSTALSTFGGKVLDSAMGVQDIIPPIPELFYNPSNPDVVSHQLIEKGTGSDSAEMQQAKLYYKADLRIVDGVATNRNGNPVSLCPGVVSSPSFYDMREQATMNITQVNIGTLVSCGQAPLNGILYVSQAGSNKGVRLVNGATLPSGGLTVVSENPVYIRGDYNTVTKKPAAVLGDAITVLSNNWELNQSDTKGDDVTSDRLATSTTVNAAFALGPSAESVVNQGNGQLENVIRFLEKWSGSGQVFTYSGSIIALWHSQRAQGAWRCCGNGGTPPNYYNAPTRTWSYDVLFDTNLPPGTPSGTVFLRGRWSQQDY